ncbi:MAG: hypothetical protein EPN69_15220 [Rhodanobacter sp.]|nr:MAG: hypothetical protein EPN69_15220 [Rhodanobacter sp.]TAL90423.1 MAG: hypothetical protein EPN71_13210 [Rhodanobacter sp.]
MFNQDRVLIDSQDHNMRRRMNAGHCHDGRPGSLDLHPNDVAATWLVFAPDPDMPPLPAYDAPVRNLVDPDGHHLAIV